MKAKLVVLFIMTLLVACSGTPEPTAAVEPTATDVPATATSEPTETLEPTETPEPTATKKPTRTPKPTNTKTPKPTNTKTPKPTNTKTPKPTNTKTPKATKTSTATATAEATATPDYIANPPRRQGSPEHESTGRRKYYPPGSYEFIHNQFYVPQPPGEVPTEYVAALPGVSRGICPLTGQTASPEWLQRRPINVRFDNSPSGRPQAGMEGADVVWEALAEGGLTRLTATFHCQAPNIVGPIRSARLMDLQITPMLEAWFVHAGAAQPVTDMIWASAYADRSINEWESTEGFYRIDRAPLGWLRTYSNNQLIRSVINQTDNVNLPASLRGWIFNQVAPRGATGTATEISIPYQAGPVNYYYNAGSGRYARYQGQTAHTQQSGYHLAPRNIMVILSPMSRSTIVEDSNGALSLHFKLHGKGDALLFRDGQVWEAQWRREGENTLIRIVDENDLVIPLAIGQTWVQIVPDTMEVQWQE